MSLSKYSSPTTIKQLSREAARTVWFYTIFCKNHVFEAPYARLVSNSCLCQKSQTFGFRLQGKDYLLSPTALEFWTSRIVWLGKGEKNRTAVQATGITHYSQRQVLTSVKRNMEILSVCIIILAHLQYRLYNSSELTFNIWEAGSKISISHHKLAFVLVPKDLADYSLLSLSA